jgi:hypothetical protein
MQVFFICSKQERVCMPRALLVPLSIRCLILPAC